MKYFKPELFVKLQECDSPDEFRAINAKWESAVQNYGRHLKSLGPRLSGGLTQFVRHGSLHDAKVIAIGDAKRKFTVVVQEELVPTLLSLTYSLADDAIIERDSFAEEHRTTEAVWLYDEIDMDLKSLPREKSRRKIAVGVPQANAQKTVFRHAILLSNGWEIRLRFLRLSFTRAASLLQTSENGTGRPSHPLPIARR